MSEDVLTTGELGRRIDTLAATVTNALAEMVHKDVFAAEQRLRDEQQHNLERRINDIGNEVINQEADETRYRERQAASDQEYREQQARLAEDHRKQIRNGLIYPIVVAVFASVLSAALAVVVTLIVHST